MAFTDGGHVMTRNSNLGLYAVAAAILVVGVVALDVPLDSLALLGLVLVCPVMMIFMMRGMTSMTGGEDHTGHGCEHDPTRPRVERPDERQR